VLAFLARRSIGAGAQTGQKARLETARS